ncbi:MAG: conserved exported protein of unknown function [Nitrospira sp.]|nr:MAG: conserved exported protein of unknown function [Nitrospira sp.]
MNITINRLASLMLGAMLLAGCAKPPAEQIDAAEKALKDAQMSGAATYSAQEYAKLEASVTAMKKEVTDQDGKFALFRDYGKAEQLAVSAKTDSELVKADAVKKKEEAKAGALQAQQVAQEAVKSAVELVAGAPVGKDRAALEAIKNDVEALKASLNQIQLAIDKEDYPAAQAQAKAIHDKGQSVSAELKNALAKVGRGKPSAQKKK